MYMHINVFDHILIVVQWITGCQSWQTFVYTLYIQMYIWPEILYLLLYLSWLKFMLSVMYKDHLKFSMLYRCSDISQCGRVANILDCHTQGCGFEPHLSHVLGEIYIPSHVKTWLGRKFERHTNKSRTKQQIMSEGCPMFCHNQQTVKVQIKDVWMNVFYKLRWVIDCICNLSSVF